MDLQEQAKFIEIREVIRKKSPKLAKWIPGPVLRYLERTIHEEEINYIMTRYHDQFGLEFVTSLLQELGVEVQLEGVENIPLEDSVIFASNHPLGGLDGVAFMQAIGQYRKDVKFLVNDILMNIRNLEPLFIPVNKIGGQSKSGIAAIEQAYASGSKRYWFSQLGLFLERSAGKWWTWNGKKASLVKQKNIKRILFRYTSTVRIPIFSIIWQILGRRLACGLT